MSRVAIIVPTHNRPELLQRALASIRAQTYQDYAVLVVDDGDQSVQALVESLQDERIAYLRSPRPHSGGAVTRNTGIRAAVAPYIAFLDDDDQWEPEKLALQMAALERSPATGFSVTSVKVEGDMQTVENPVAEGTHDFLPDLLSRFKGFLTSTLIVRRDVLNETGLFDESFPSHQESDLLLRIAQRYKGVGVHRVLVRMDVRSTHEHISSSLERRIKGREMLLVKHQELYAKHPLILAKHHFWLGLWYRETRAFEEARSHFWKAFSLSPHPRYLLHALLVSLSGKGV